MMRVFSMGPPGQQVHETVYGHFGRDTRSSPHNDLNKGRYDMSFRLSGPITLATLLALASPVVAQEDYVRLAAENDVTATMDALEAAVREAGATVFARVDHAAGAATVDMEMRPTQLLIFGNPQLGTAAIQDDVLAGLALPIRVLAYEDAEGQTWLAYESPDAMLGALDGIADDADYIARITGAIENLTAAAAGD
jgi:uncharacterized protein (DUF302 family)